MTWLNGSAWLGLVSLVVPLLIHLLAQRKARVQKFPTLRFLQNIPLVQARRTRLADLLLLIVRTALLLLAVAALAQPLLLTDNRVAQMGATVARVIIVDSSASMKRVNSSGGAAIDAARTEAERLAAEATTGVVVQTIAPAAAMEGASQWLQLQRGQREIVVISDFQRGSLAAADLSAVPQEIGFRTIRMQVAAVTQPLAITTGYLGGESVALVSLDNGRTTVQWSDGGQAGAGQPTIAVAAAPSEMAGASAATAAAAAVGTLQPGANNNRVVVVLPEYERSANLLASAREIDAPWMGDLMASLAADSLLLIAARREDAVQEGGETRATTPLVRGAVVTLDGVEQLALFSAAPAGSIGTAALITATANALSNQTAVAEFDPEYVTDAVLAGWQRDASARASIPEAELAGLSDGRWLWVVVLGLLALEWRLRRATTRRTAVGAAV
jgi:hypothetical protein